MTSQDDTEGDNLHYTSEHEWLLMRERGVRGTVRVGITDYAQEQLGDIVFVDLPDTGGSFDAGDVFGEVESTKSVSELFMPLAGEVVAVNDTLTDSPELLNSDPYGDGWLIEIAPREGQDTSGLLDASAYQALVQG